MPKSFSIAEARQDLASLVHQLEHQSRIELTRRGKRVAVLMSAREYDRMAKPKHHFWEAYEVFANTMNLPELKIDPSIFSNLRDRSGGREANW